MLRAVEDAAGIERHILFDEIIVRVSVQHHRDIRHDQAFLEVGDEGVSVVGRDRLLLVLRQALALRIIDQRAGERDGCRAGGIEERIVAQRRERRGDDALGEILVVDVCDIENAEALFPQRRVEILAAVLEIEHLAALRAVVIRGIEDGTRIEVFLIEIRICVAVQVAADHRLRLRPFRPDDTAQPVMIRADIREAPEEIHRPGAEAQQLGHDRVVVVVFRNVAIGAVLRGADPAGGVGEMRIESLPRIALCGDGLLLGVEPLAVRPLRADKHRAR